MSELQPSVSPRRSVKSWLDVIATVGMIVAAGAVTWTTLRPSTTTSAARREIPVPSTPIDVTGVPTIGSPEAAVVLIEFSDFQCPYCGRFARESWPILKTEYVDSGRIQMAFRHRPLTALHAQAWRAAEAAECAARQGKFWPLHDALFSTSADLSDAGLSKHAAAVALDQAAFTRCMSGDATARVTADNDLASELQFSGTPTFVVGTLRDDGRVDAAKVIAGAAPIAQFRAELDRLLANPSE